ncbi:AraC-like DNA-binding protein [Saonia flava]|uniref:AraC-like DNA-binding protein n=1 Tax=Saonia flava TaxID=523696 RepID=A0A846QTN2_9FLAO|nr:nickel-binding protein [Saonia flava]NJB72326.1 AraC-like DNA-binding protein [Saonia flava]
MPIYMDFHDLPVGVSAKDIAEMHQADLKIEHKYNCRGLTYWCDERRQTAFCLIEAPNKGAIKELHEKSHGAVPQRIIEVNDTLVESFLGRIEDPENAQNTELNIVTDSAFRILMVIHLKKKVLRTENIETLHAALRGYKKSVINIISKHKGRIVKQESNSFLMSFTSATNAVESAIKIQELHNCVITPDLEFKVGISAGNPVTNRDSIFEDTVKKAEYLTYVTNGNIILTPEVKDLYESENQNDPINIKGTKPLSSTEMEFIIRLFEYTESVWTNSNISATNYNENLGLSKSKLYRTIMPIIGKSPNSFIKEFRLNKALEFLDKQVSNISEIAYQTGFSSPAYFSKCFKEVYGILPSQYNRLQLE